MGIYQKPASIIPQHDEERLLKLYGYEILDTPAEQAFDKLAKLAAQIFDTPGAYITFVDKERVFFKATLHPEQGNEVLREDSLCSLSILENGVTVFNDTHQIPALLESPHVSCEGGIRFYAGAPLKTREGHQLGTICVVDSVSRQVSEKQIQMLETLSTVVVDELEHRQASRKAIRVQTDLLNITAHDLKNPAININLLTELILKKSGDQAFIEMIAAKVKLSAEDMLQKIEGLLHLSRIEDGDFELSADTFKVQDFLQSLKNSFELQAQQKEQSILINCPEHIQMTADKKRLQEIMENLLSNALKFSYEGSQVLVTAMIKQDQVVISVKDQGQGLSEEDKEKLFTKFARLSATPTGKERSNKLGLSIVKTLVELHQGKVWAQSDGKNKGTTFFISMPANPVQPADAQQPGHDHPQSKVKF